MSNFETRTTAINYNKCNNKFVHFPRKFSLFLQNFKRATTLKPHCHMRHIGTVIKRNTIQTGTCLLLNKETCKEYVMTFRHYSMFKEDSAENSFLSSLVLKQHPTNLSKQSANEEKMDC
ncbi:hypothetical protein T07_11667 [Trichinella nelsoni]|uniref:Uncharacterized protein n=1 Tax=Trichinella nelsoni TaxID=6336 RepID=A0A0V0SA21_9BILA|nr:hypothetical protein T07_11667 [Trichinella nelsoni]